VSLAVRQETPERAAVVQRLAAAAAWRTRSLEILCIGLLTVTLFVGLGSRPLSDPDEGRNGEVAQEMVRSGEFLEPHLDRLPYIDKPFVYFAVVAGSFELLGASEWAGRLPSALATLLTALVTAGLARRLFGAGAGVPAALALLATPLTWIFGQLLILDALFTLWVVGAIGSLYLAIEAADAGRRRARLGWMLAGWGCVALGVLTKGPVGLLLPLAACAPLALRRRALAVLFDLRGVALAAALIAPWVWLMATRVPDYLHYVAVVETWRRVATGALNRDRPFWYLPLLLVPGAFPASGIAIAAGWHAARSGRLRIDPRWLLIVSWILVPLVLFSLARSKMPQYVLPLIPAVALAAAGVCSRARDGALPGVRAASLAWILVGLALAASPLVHPVRALSEPFRSQAHLAAAAAAVGAIAVGLYALRGRLLGPRALAIATLPLIVLYFAGQPIFAHALEHRSSVTLAAPIRAALPPGGRLIGVSAYPQSLAFYLGRPIELASPDAFSLSSNYLIATYGRWLGPDSTLHPIEYWRSALAACDVPSIFIVRAPDSAAREVLRRAGLRALAADAHYAAYGPCRTPPAAQPR